MLENWRGRDRLCPGLRINVERKTWELFTSVLTGQNREERAIGTLTGV
jgi:hypothetical protein